MFHCTGEVNSTIQHNNRLEISLTLLFAMNRNSCFVNKSIRDLFFEIQNTSTWHAIATLWHYWNWPKLNARLGLLAGLVDLYWWMKMWTVQIYCMLWIEIMNINGLICYKEWQHCWSVEGEDFKVFCWNVWRKWKSPCVPI